MSIAATNSCWLPIITTVWWLFFFTALGLCIGSFLNVVVYRLPRDQSVLDPVWSFCPCCHERIRWYDNLPVLSFLLLRGRCRHCQDRISLRYPTIEMLTALGVIALVDTFFIARMRTGLLGDPHLISDPHLTWALSQDWPILLAHIILFACLLAMAIIDLQEYWVDIRFTTVATFCGFLLHALWTPAYSVPRTNLRGEALPGWHRPDDATAAAALGALAGLGMVWCWLRARPRAGEPEVGEATSPELPDQAVVPEAALAPDGLAGSSATEGAAPETQVELPAAESHDAPAELEASEGVGSVIGALAVGVTLVALLLAAGLESGGSSSFLSGAWRGLLPPALIFLAIMVNACVSRESDQQIMEVIEAERSSARRVAMGELAILLPAIVLGGAAVWIHSSSPAVADWWASALGWAPTSGEWRPVCGLATAAAGYVIGGGIGWAVRIVFTLAFGKEAFGLGDIHMMAAAGCVAGWPIVLLGFIVTVFVAMAAWLLSLPFKRTRAIPLVPWLALGYLIVVVHYERILDFAPISNALDVFHMLFVSNSQPGLLGGAL